MKILCVIGTRPEVIKMAPVIKELKTEHDVISVSTGQHRELLSLAAKTFDLSFDFNLDIMANDQKITDVLSLAIKEISKIISKEKPDLILGQGDTSTALAAALSAYYNRIPFGHIEAGLRTRNYENPWPEEMNREIISKLSTLHFCPTINAKNNLISENIVENIFITGNTVIDSLLENIDKNIKSKNTILLTIHRRENFGEPLDNVLDAINEIADRNDVRIKFPVHPNPNIKNKVFNKIKNQKIEICEPLEYKDFVNTMAESILILTDSGGIQEEVSALKKPILILRDFTERPEVVECGIGKLVGTSKEKIVFETEKLLYDKKYYDSITSISSPYGDGTASKNILKSINFWKNK